MYRFLFCWLICASFLSRKFVVLLKIYYFCAKLQKRFVMDDTSIDIIIEVAFVVGAILFSLVKGWIGKKSTNRRPESRPVPRENSNIWITFGNHEPVQEQMPPQPVSTTAPQRPRMPLFSEGERVTTARARSIDEPATTPHVSGNVQRREAALRRLGLKNKDELRRAIILGQILERPQP